MIDLREHLQELADAAARHGGTPGPAAAIRRGRQRRRRIAGAAAAVLALALAVGSGATGRLVGRPDLPATGPATTLPPLPRLDLRNVEPLPPAEAAAYRTLAAEVRRCPGGSSQRPQVVGRFRPAELNRLVMIVAKAPRIGEPTICWTAGVFDLDGAGKGPGRVTPVSIATPLTVAASRSSGYGVVRGLADQRAVRVRVRFRDRPGLLEVPVIQGGVSYVANLYVALFPPDWTPVEVTAFDAEGRRLAGCTLPDCPGG